MFVPFCWQLLGIASIFNLILSMMLFGLAVFVVRQFHAR
jgi:hypothetical protein